MKGRSHRSTSRLGGLRHTRRRDLPGSMWDTDPIKKGSKCETDTEQEACEAGGGREACAESEAQHTAWQLGKAEQSRGARGGHPAWTGSGKRGGAACQEALDDPRIGAVKRTGRHGLRDGCHRGGSLREHTRSKKSFSGRRDVSRLEDTGLQQPVPYTANSRCDATDPAWTGSGG